MDEQQAIRRLKNGDIGGLEFLVMRYQTKALRVAYLITGDQPTAEDIVQDCFIHIFRAIQHFDASRPFEPWFMRSVVNASVKRMHRRPEMQYAADDAAWEQLTGNTVSAETEVESSEAQQQIWEMMQRLSPRQRAVIVQRYFLGMSEKEMAAESGTTVGTIKWLLNAARERLRHLLTERSEK